LILRNSASAQARETSAVKIPCPARKAGGMAMRGSCSCNPLSPFSGRRRRDWNSASSGEAARRAPLPLILSISSGPPRGSCP